MRFSNTLLVAAAGIPAVVAHAGDDLFAMRRHLQARQGTSGTSSGTSVSTSGTPSVPTGSTTGVPTGVPSGGTTGSANSTTPSITFTLLATNPTAVPLSSIISNQPTVTTKPLHSSATPGATPTLIQAALIAPKAYPSLDVIPPTDSPEVQQWIKEVADSGVSIPGFSPTVDGGCVANAAAAADKSRCWWTCGGCTRKTDITECPTAMDWGLTYDDGPAFYTSNLLEYLDQSNLKSTFFVVGSRVISFPATLQAEYLGGHQIAVHTWSHHSLTSMTNEQIIAELGWSKKAIKDVLGVTPNMMRPPFGDIDDRVRAISLAMGLVPVMWTRISPLATFDTDDFNIHNGKTSVQQVLNNWENILGNATTRQTGFIVLEHDLFLESVETATGYILPDALAHQPPFGIKPVITCLNKPLSDAYIETNNNQTNPPAIAAGVSAGDITVTGTATAGLPSSTGKSSAMGLTKPSFGVALTAAVGFLFAVSL